MLRSTRNPSFICETATCACTLPRRNSSISLDITDEMRRECYCWTKAWFVLGFKQFPCTRKVHQWDSLLTHNELNHLSRAVHSFTVQCTLTLEIIFLERASSHFTLHSFSHLLQKTKQHLIIVVFKCKMLECYNAM